MDAFSECPRRTCLLSQLSSLSNIARCCLHRFTPSSTFRTQLRLFQAIAPDKQAIHNVKRSLTTLRMQQTRPLSTNASVTTSGATNFRPMVANEPAEAVVSNLSSTATWWIPSRRGHVVRAFAPILVCNKVVNSVDSNQLPLGAHMWSNHVVVVFVTHRHLPLSFPAPQGCRSILPVFSTTRALCLPTRSSCTAPVPCLPFREP